jgi:hypothetical protein
MEKQYSNIFFYLTNSYQANLRILILNGEILNASYMNMISLGVVEGLELG